MTESTDRLVVQCNYIVGTKIAVSGARAYLANPAANAGYARIEILVRSRGGRWICRWEDIRRLVNFRAKTLSPGHPRYGDDRPWPYDAHRWAATLAAASNAARLATAGPQ